MFPAYPTPTVAKRWSGSVVRAAKLARRLTSPARPEPSPGKSSPAFTPPCPVPSSEILTSSLSRPWSRRLGNRRASPLPISGDRSASSRRRRTKHPIAFRLSRFPPRFRTSRRGSSSLPPCRIDAAARCPEPCHPSPLSSLLPPRPRLARNSRYPPRTHSCHLRPCL